MKLNGTDKLLNHKNIGLDTQTIMLSGLVQKFSQRLFLQMVANVTRLRVSHNQSFCNIF